MKKNKFLLLAVFLLAFASSCNRGLVLIEYRGDSDLFLNNSTDQTINVHISLDSVGLLGYFHSIDYKKEFTIQADERVCILYYHRSGPSPRFDTKDGLEYYMEKTASFFLTDVNYIELTYEDGKEVRYEREDLTPIPTDNPMYLENYERSIISPGLLFFDFEIEE